MKYPNHILLDINRVGTQKLTNSWIITYKSTFINKTLKKSIKNVSTNDDVIILVSRRKKNLKKNNSLLWSIFDINFLKKEKIYTKLKYSRSPAYDMVSGGVAALFAGFLGFLISEKFGIELVDSGDFYTFFMYCVFLSFSLRPFLKILSKNNTIWHFFSYKFLLNYLIILVNLIIKYFLTSFIKIKFLLVIPKFLVNNNYLITIINFFSKQTKSTIYFPIICCLLNL